LNFRQGPVPQVIEDSPFAITGYRPADVPDDGVMVVTNIIVRDPSHPTPPGDPLETVSSAMIRWYRQDDITINVIILLLSDSANGVRYVGNFARITHFQRSSQQRLPKGMFSNPTGDALVVQNSWLSVDYLDQQRSYDGSLLPIASGYSDVTAHTIVRYGNFPNINVAGLQGILTPETYGPVQT